MWKAVYLSGLELEAMRNICRKFGEQNVLNTMDIDIMKGIKAKLEI